MKCDKPEENLTVLYENKLIITNYIYFQFNKHSLNDVCQKSRCFKYISKRNSHQFVEILEDIYLRVELRITQDSIHIN